MGICNSSKNSSSKEKLSNYNQSVMSPIKIPGQNPIENTKNSLLMHKTKAQVYMIC